MGKAFGDGISRVVAAALSTVIAIGFAGCDMFGVRKSMGIMHGRLTNFNKAINELDYETARSHTDWTEEDSDYTAIEELFDTSYYGDTEGEGFVACTEYIASTVTIKFDITSARIGSGRASLDVRYEMVDWQQVYQEKHDSYDEVLEDLKNCPDKLTFDADIVFENVDKNEDWRLCRITNLSEVMSFVHTLPDVAAPEAAESVGET